MEETGFYDKVERFDRKKRLDEGRPPKKPKFVYKKNMRPKATPSDAEGGKKSTADGTRVKRKREGGGEAYGNESKKAKTDSL